MHRTLLAIALAVVLAVVPATADAAVRHVIRGAGFGHGIGMSQYGAYGFALKGRGYQEIMAHYYKGTRLGSAPSRAVRVLLQPSDPYIRVRGATRSAGPLFGAAPPTSRATPAEPCLVTTASGRRVGRFGNGARFEGLGPAAAARPGAQRDLQRALPRRGRAPHRGRRRDRHQRARHRLLRPRRGGRRDALVLAARGPQGAGGHRPHLCARHAQDDRPVRPVPRHPLAGLPRRDR